MLQVLEDTKTKASAQRRAKDDAPLFSAANVTEARRAKAWLEAMLTAHKKPGAPIHFESNVAISPAMAELMLERNTANRPLSANKVKQWAAKINEGRWRQTSQGFSFGWNGRLLDGQHRLAGIVASGRTVHAVVSFGQDPENFQVLDCGKVRGLSDGLALDGFENWNHVAAGARLLMAIESGTLGRNRGFYDNDELIAFARERRENLSEAARLGLKVIRKVHGASAAVVAALFLILKDSEASGRAEEFVTLLTTGVGLPKRSPILKLRDAMMTRAVGAEVRHHADRTTVVAGSIITTWNAWLQGSRGVSLWRFGTTFPEVI